MGRHRKPADRGLRLRTASAVCWLTLAAGAVSVAAGVSDQPGDPQQVPVQASAVEPMDPLEQAAEPELGTALERGTRPDTGAQPQPTRDTEPEADTASEPQASSRTEPEADTASEPQASSRTEPEPTQGTEAEPGDAPEPGNGTDPADSASSGDVPAPPGLADPTPEGQTPSAQEDAEKPSPAVVASTGLSLSIPAIGVQSVLNPSGVDEAGALEVPARGPRYDEAAYFTGSPYPGQTGPTVLLGHVNGRGGAPSVFYRLAELATGDVVTVTRDDGTTVSYEVYDAQRYNKDEFPTATVYGDTAGPELRLITCGGDWVASVGHYRDNVVVYARIVPTAERPLRPRSGGG